MANRNGAFPFPHCFLTLLVLTVILAIVSRNINLVPIAEAAQRSVHIPDDLDDVVDDEEDEAWRQWGQRSSPPPPDSDFPPDLSNLDLADFQEEMMRRQVGPTYGVVKLRPGARRTPGAVTEISMRWAKVLKTGGIDVNFMGVDLNTILFTLMRGQDTLELKEFLLDQPDAYEIKIGDGLFRRPGDPPLEKVMEKLHHDKQVEEAIPEDGASHSDEL